MKSRLVLLATLWLIGSPAIHAAETATDRTVVMISLDGLAHYYLDDPKAEMPTIRQLVKEGARAERMKAVMPSVTWPNHTTLVTGVSPARHGVVGNTYLDRKTNTVVPLIWDPTLNKEDIIQVPTIYDAAKQAGLKTAAVTWPGSRAAKSLDWTVPCVNKSDLFVQFSTPSLLEEFKQAGIPYENEAEGFKEGQGEARDRLHVQMFNHILRTHRPHLALLHLLEVDHVEHAHGPQTPEAYHAVQFVDSLVKEVQDELNRTFPGKVTLIITSDHGFFNYRQRINVNVALRQAGLLTAFSSKITGGKVRALSQGGSSMLYITDPTDREATIAQVVKLFSSMEGVSLTVTEKDFPKYGFASPATQPQMADIVLSAREGYIFNDVVAGEEVISAADAKVRGTHGYDPNEPRLHATFVAWGAGIQPGTNAGIITNTAVAPTIAHLLSLPFPNTEAQPLTSILQKTPPK